MIPEEEKEFNIVLDDDGKTIKLRVNSATNCSKGGNHKVVHKNRSNFCENCGLVFDEDIISQKDRKCKTIESDN